MTEPVYLDYAAGTEATKGVKNAMKLASFANPSALYSQSRVAKDQLTQARSAIAAVLEVKPKQLIFCATATEANNIALQGIVAQYKNSVVACLSTEHAAVRSVNGARTILLPVNTNGLIDLESFPKLVTDQTVVVSVAAVNSELGVVQPLIKIAKLIKGIRADRLKRGIRQPLYLHSDASQAMYTSLKPHALKVDMLTINGSKLGGPHAALLYMGPNINLTPILHGGGQERGLRPGTENVANALGLAEAITGLNSAETVRLAKLRDYVEAKIVKLKGKVLCADAPRSPHISSILFKGVDNETLCYQLDEAGIAVGIGSACHASSAEPSLVLRAIGLTAEEAQSVIRLSYGAPTSKAQLDYALEQLALILQK